jgi:heme o synthase
MSRLKAYYYLTKPGIIRGNAVTAAAGFLLAAHGHISWGLFVAMLVGLSLVIGSACVFNNYIDRGIDRVMARTRNRALVKGAVSGRGALVFGTVLGLAGGLVLLRYVNVLAAAWALLGFVVYVALYGISKRRSVWGTVVGSISGAVPPVVGYVAVTNRFDVTALWLFVILALWQMPHFYAIAIFRLDDYKAAKLPVLPVAEGVRVAQAQILGYVAAFTVAAPLLAVWGGASYTYGVVMVVLGVAWFVLGLRGFRARDTKRWARGMFGFSLVVITAWSVLLMVNAVLP